MVHEHGYLIFLFGFSERVMFYQMKPMLATYLLHQSARASSVFPYFNQSLKFLQSFKVFNILRYHGPYLRS